MDIKKQFPFIVAVPAVIWQILFLYLPLTFIISSSFFKSWHLLSLADFTVENLATALNAVHLRIIWFSLLQALIVTVICLLVGYPVAYYFAMRFRHLKNIFLFFLTLPFWTNFLVQAYAWFFIIGRDGIINNALLRMGLISEPLHILYTPFAVILVMVYCYLPFMILPLYGILEKFDQDLIEASLDLGATPQQTFWNVTLPLTLSGIRNGFFLVFIPAFGEYTIPAIMGGGNQFYVGSLISSYFLESRNPALGAAFTVVSSIILLTFALIVLRILTPASPQRKK